MVYRQPKCRADTDYRLQKARSTNYSLNIFSVCVINQITLEPEWLPKEADLISRIVDYDDWRLDPLVFAGLDKR